MQGCLLLSCGISQLLPGSTRLAASRSRTSGLRRAADAAVDAVKPFVSRQVWAMIELQRLTGMRAGEVCIMRGCDINPAS